ncbi:SDR family NAD(P)-dependent oxidoreductase [Halococcus hamelinensis]|uniref:Short-chain dehydrogenase/reductase SDR n=1 Tax=Halococcus hamelinensis 100A6 TaxID=1132509 RepID=M0M1I1_9EURY|nr:SDR family NAD(P)-dependent oxidoreductase [Halococcus hamelinensis]EMA39278.1 short-chain dehydrogenase/reductase SDR [Halococcus hamelinensis 100A6]
MDTNPERVALVTGATSGIGRAAARRLGSIGWTVAVTGRDAERGRRTVEEVEETGGEATFLRADLADVETVAALADAVRERYDRLDVLVNNAACSPGERRLTDDGHERSFAVNHLAPYRLTHDLLPLLAASGPARVVTTASTLHRRGELDFDDLRLDSGYDPLDAYARSKLANVLFATELAARLGKGVTASVVHPGFVPGSGLYRDASLSVRTGTRLAARLPGVGTSVEDGAEGLVYAAVAPAAATRSGAYYEGTRPTEPDPRAHDERLRERLWTQSAAMVGVDPDWP